MIGRFLMLVVMLLSVLVFAAQAASEKQHKVEKTPLTTCIPPYTADCLAQENTKKASLKGCLPPYTVDCLVLEKAKSLFRNLGKNMKLE